MILWGPGKYDQCFLPTCFQLAPRNEGVGIDFQKHQGTATGIRSEYFFEEFDFLEDGAVSEIFGGCPSDEESQVCWQNQREHANVARVLAVALVKTEKTMAFAAKEIDGIDHFDAIEDRCALAQMRKFLLSDSIDTRHQINQSERRLLERQDSELSVDRGSVPHQTAAFGV